MTKSDDATPGMFEGPLSNSDRAVIGVLILSIAMLSLYFIIAMFVPKMRPRWSISRRGGMRGIRPVTILGPKFGPVTCLGTSIFVAALPIPLIEPDWGFNVVFGIFVTGAILIAIGGMIDSIRGRSEYRRK